MKKITQYIYRTIFKASITRLTAFGIILTALFTSCESFLEVDLPESKITSELVFSDDITATAAVTGMYVELLSSESFASGGNKSITFLAGLSADEFNYYPDNIEAKMFEQNNLIPANSNVEALWVSMYKTIYQANAVIEGLSTSKGVTQETKDQLLGEALFIRAFSHFYLVNLFGDVPLVTSTDYQKNSLIPRTAVLEVQNQIVDDLRSARDLLGENYVTTESDLVTTARVRPNKATASAFLAKVYLHVNNWEGAETEASAVINNSATYSLVEDLDAVFLANSTEAIWQLQPFNPLRNTNEGALFILTGAPNLTRPVGLTTQLLDAFEDDDSRVTKWINSRIANTVTYYYPFKYKVRTGPGSPLPVPLSEYSMVLRLGEQYLIRSEARAKQGNLSGAIADLDAIRGRADLPLIGDVNPDISQDDLILAIEHERQVELFSEWGNRWLDLKRTDRADEILAPIKAQWNSEDVLYPIPQSEFNRNPKLGDQNQGY
jgi:hypothetical protein